MANRMFFGIVLIIVIYLIYKDRGGGLPNKHMGNFRN